MPVNHDEKIITETTLERTKRLVADIEELIRTTGEHPEYELKKTWKKDSPFLKAEFIKDIQSIANSRIPTGKAKFIIVGADEGTREITGCNHSEYDEAKIRQLLESYLDPAPDYEILYPRAANGNPYVVIRFPHQTRKPFFVKSEIVDEKKQRFLSVGEVWLKPTGSTGKKRLASRSDLLEMIDNEALINKEVEYRISQLLPEIRQEERTRLGSSGGVGAIPSLTSTDEEFELFLEQIIATGDFSRFNVLLQKLRDKCAESWELKIDEGVVLSVEEIRQERDTMFLPAMRRLALLGLLVIKFEAPFKWFRKIADLLIETFNVSNELSTSIPHETRQQKFDSLENLLNNYVPALESLMVSNLLIGYEIKKKGSVKYTSTLFPRLVTYKSDFYYSSGEEKIFYLLFPFYRHTIDRRIDLLTAERYQEAESIRNYLGGETAIRTTLLQVIALIDWLSFLSFVNLTKEPKLSAYFSSKYPDINTAFNSVYTQESLENISPLVKKIWADLSTGENNFFLLDAELAKVFSTLSIPKRKEIFARFLIEALKIHAQRMHAQMRFPFDVHWSQEINSTIESVKNNL